jgi:quinol monooxygenase YgiN
MITFVGAGLLKADAMENTLEAIKNYVATINDEAGTVQYIVVQQKDEPRRIIFLEQYQDEQAQKAHGDKPGFPAFRETLMAAVDQMDFIGTFDVIAVK